LKTLEPVSADTTTDNQDSLRMLRLFNILFFMKIYLDKNNQLNCIPSDTLFKNNVANLLKISSPYTKYIQSVDTINVDTIVSLGNICRTILLTKFNDSTNDLFDETSYPKIFVGTYSENFVEIMKLIQKLWQLSSHLDTYPTLELVDKGVRPKDKEYFTKTLKPLRNRLLLLENKVQKNREL